MNNLRDKDDEMMQKKRTVCTMQHEHREYSLQNLPLDRMKCVRKAGDAASNTAVSVAASALPPLSAVVLLPVAILLHLACI